MTDYAVRHNHKKRSPAWQAPFSSPGRSKPLPANHPSPTCRRAICSPCAASASPSSPKIIRWPTTCACSPAYARLSSRCWTTRLPAHRSTLRAPANTSSTPCRRWPPTPWCARGRGCRCSMPGWMPSLCRTTCRSSLPSTSCAAPTAASARPGPWRWSVASTTACRRRWCPFSAPRCNLPGPTGCSSSTSPTCANAKTRRSARAAAHRPWPG